MSFPRYPKYKDSGVEWLGEVPEHWETKRLKNLLSEPLKYGANESAEDEDRSHPRFVRITDITDAGGLREDTFKSLPPDVAAPYLLQPGDVLLARSGATVGKSVICSSDWGIACFAGYLIRARLRIDKCLPKWFLFFCQTHIYRDYVTGSQIQATIQNVSAEKYASLHVPLPYLDEQHAIVTFLDRETAKIDALIAEQQRLIELLQEKRQAVISHAVTKGLNPDAPMKDSGIEWLGEVPEHWRIGRCRFYVDMLSGFAFPSQGFSDDEGDWRLLRGINVGVGSIRWEDIVYWKREPNDGLDAYEMRQSDLVIGMDRPLISDGMRVARLTEQDVPSLLLQRVVRLTPLPPVDAEYLQHLLSSEMFVAHFAPETTGVSVPHISPDQIAAFVIPVPPIHEQKAIVKQVRNQIAELAGLMNEASQSVDLLQERRAALISAAVTGQIDVRGFAGSDAA